MVELFAEEHRRAFTRFKSEMTVEKAFREGNSIKACYRKEAEETIEVICYLIIDFAQSINVGKNITDGQVDEIAYTICTRFHDLTIEELLIVFSNAKAGRYGKLFDRLDVNVVSDFIISYYAKERADYLEKANSAKSFKMINLLDAVINCETPENPEIQKARKSLKNLGKEPEKREKEFSVTAAVPKHSDYLGKAKNIIEKFSVKELKKFRGYAIRANWNELLDLIQEEFNKRKAEYVNRAKSIVAKCSLAELKGIRHELNEADWEELSELIDKEIEGRPKNEDFNH